MRESPGKGWGTSPEFAAPQCCGAMFVKIAALRAQNKHLQGVKLPLFHDAKVTFKTMLLRNT
jgi:hypothetical protein